MTDLSARVDAFLKLAGRLGPSFHAAVAAVSDFPGYEEHSAIERDDTGECVIDCMHDEYTDALLPMLNTAPALVAELLAERERLLDIEHAAWHALDDCEVRDEGAVIMRSDYDALSKLLPEDHPEPRPSGEEGG